MLSVLLLLLLLLLRLPQNTHSRHRLAGILCLPSLSS
jgi:hypothetical protein